MVIREYLNSSNRMPVRIAAGMSLAFFGIILTSVVMGLLLFVLSHSGLGASVVVAIVFLMTFPISYLLVAKLPDIRLSKSFKLFALLVFVLFALIVLFISLVAAPPTTPPRHISFAN